MKHLPIWIRKWLAARWFLREFKRHMDVIQHAPHKGRHVVCHDSYHCGKNIHQKMLTRYNLTEQTWNP